MWNLADADRGRQGRYDTQESNLFIEKLPERVIRSEGPLEIQVSK